MPRTARVKYETIFEVLKELPIFTETGELKKQKDPVWKAACKIMPEINVHNLYLFVQQDRRNIKTNLMKFMNITLSVPLKMKKRKKEPKYERYDDVWDNYDYYDTLDNEDTQEVALNDLDTLLSMSNSEEYRDAIHKVGLLPFSVTYWHPQQIVLWNDLINIESTVSLIVLDNVISNLTGNFNSNNVFLYALAVELENSVILLAQMMSDSIQSLEISHFLNIWLQKNATAPLELVTGYSYSLLDAASLSFNFCTFDQYNLRCFKYLMNESMELPGTLICIDVIGLIKVVDGWMCFENILQPVKDLYLCSIMYLSTVDNLDEFREAVVNILTLCQSPFQSDETEARRAALWVHLTSDTIQQMNQEYIQYLTGRNGPKSFSFYNIRQNPIITESPHEIYDFINQLKLEAFEICDFNIELEKPSNDYYCPIVLENLIQLLVEFPSWTRIFVKNNKCSTLVSTCATNHLATFTELSDSINPPQFLVYHFEKIQKLTNLGKHFINIMKNRNEFIKKDFINNHAHLQAISNREHEYDDRIEISMPPNEDVTVTENTEFDLLTFKNTIRSTIHSLLDFDDSVNNILKMQTLPGQEIKICKILLDCCTELKSYEKYIGTIAGRLCSGNNNFSTAFRQLFQDCYKTVELFDKNELRNTSKLFAHLLISDSVSWEILSIIHLIEKEMTNAKKNFIRILLRELSEHMGIAALEKRFRDKAYKIVFKGLFPTESPKKALFAATFYKAIGLKSLGDIVKDNMKDRKDNKDNKKEEEAPPILKRSSSNSSLSSTSSSSDFIIELRVSKKNGKNGDPREVKRKVFVLK